MGTAQLLKDVIVVALDTQTDPVKALGLQPVQQPVGDGIRVGLKGDLRVVGHIKVPPQGGQNDGQGVGAVIAGGAAAEVDGVHPVAGTQGPCLLDMGAEGVQIGIHQPVILTGL